VRPEQRVPALRLMESRHRCGPALAGGYLLPAPGR
jgi:hypothetical protein